MKNEENIFKIESLFNSKKLKYEQLNELFKPFIKGYPIECNVNIFIDLQSLFKSFYNPQVLEMYNSLSKRESLIFTSEIFNIMGHYRHYFASRYSMYTTFYIYNSLEKSKYHLAIDNDYKKDYYEKRIDNNQVFNIFNTIIKEKLDYVKAIMRYIPNAHYINTKTFESSVFPYYFLNNENFRNKTNYYDNKSNLNIIITNDNLQYQSLLSNEDTIILELRGEKSRIVYQGNILETLIKDSKTKNSLNDLEFINTNHLPILYSLSSNKNYNIKGIKRMGLIRSIQFIEKHHEDILLRDIINPTIEDFPFLELFNEEEQKRFLKNFRLINYNTIINKCNYEKNVIMNEELIDLMDDDNLKITNEQLFKKYPIKLDFLFEGERE